jgi:hypothetical protein
MGVFRDWQPRYLREGIATFPMTFERSPDGKIKKKPMVTGYLKIGSKLSSKLAAKPQFADCNGIGFRVDQRYGGTRLTILDIDIADEREVPKAIERHGDTPIIVRTASGKFHLYYRYNGERRGVRAWGGDVPIDLLGGGFIAAPPSIDCDGRLYEFIRGDLSQIRNLPPIGGLDELLREKEEPQAAMPSGEKIREGKRNDTLWECCMIKAKQVQSFDELLAFAREYNGAHMQPTLSDMEVIEVVKSAWRNEERGTNYFGNIHPLPLFPPY